METYILDDSDDMWQHFAKLIGNVSCQLGSTWPTRCSVAKYRIGSGSSS